MNSKILLGIAVALNVALGALLLSGKKGAARLSTDDVQPAQVVTNSVIKKVRERIEVASQPELVQLDWRNVESPEYKTYINNLRTIRCPEETIRDIIIADVNKLYAAQWKANRKAPKKDWNYWQGDDQQYEYRYRSKERREDDRLRQKMEREKRDLLRDLLGIEVDKETRNYWMGDYEDQRDRALTFLPEEKRKQIRDIQDRWQKQMQDFYETLEPGEPWSAEQQKKQREMMKSQEAEIAQLLSPQEKEEYELRASNSANSLRHELAAFEPTEEEFKKLFRLRKAFDERFADFVHDPDDEAGQKRWSQAHSELKKEIKALLDEPRRAEYDRSQDYEYRETLAMFRSMELGREVTAKVMDMKKLVEDQVQKVRSDRTLSEDQRKTTLKEMREETEKALTEALGEKGLKRYKNERGWWIRNLK